MNPVTQALAAARLRQLCTRDDAMLAVVAEIIGATPRHDRPRPEAFERWCERKGTTALPASPAAIALFVLEHQGHGLEAVLEHLADISGAHCDAGLADPTTSHPVTAALNKISKLDPPASWPKSEKTQWLQLNYTLQAYLVRRDKDQTREIRRAQNEAAELRKQLNAQQKVETTNETPVQSPVA
jgi:hypothetical protein